MSSEKTLIAMSEIRNASIEAWKAQGKQIIGTVCCHVPEELIHAAGLLPCRVRATGCTDDSEAEVWMSPYACSYARSCLQYLMDGKYDFLDGLISSDGCLMAGRIYDNWKYVDKELAASPDYYLQQIAAPRMNNHLSVEYYRKNLEEMKAGLERFTGKEITEEALLESIALYNETRALIQQLYELRKAEFPVISGADTLRLTLAAMSMPKEEYNALLREFLAEAETMEPITDYRARLMLIGSALDDPEYIKSIEDLGGLVVTDSLCFGSRYLWEPVEPAGDALTSIATSYLERPVCPRSCDLHDELYDFIVNMVREYKVDGILFEKMKYCEIWGGESVFIEDKLKAENIPLLTVEREEIMTNTGQLGVRAEAFIEMLEDREVSAHGTSH